MNFNTIERLSPFSPQFTWDDYTNELYQISDDYGCLSIDQMKSELLRFEMMNYSEKINSSMIVEEFVDFLYDAHN